MSIRKRLDEIEKAASEKCAEKPPRRAVEWIRWFQKEKISYGLWPWFYRQYAATHGVPVYGKILPKETVDLVTEEQCRFYAKYHRKPGEAVQTDHPAYFGSWEDVKKRYPELISEAHARIVIGDESTYPPDCLQEVRSRKKRRK